MVHGPVYRGIFPTPLAFLPDVRRAKVGLLGPQSPSVAVSHRSGSPAQRPMRKVTTANGTSALVAAVAE